MTNEKPVCSVLMALLLCLSMTVCMAACTVTLKPEESGVTYSKGLSYNKNSDGTYYVNGIGSCTDTEIVIPPTYKGSDVTGIGPSAFENTNLIGVTIPDSVTSIGDHAFRWCYNLTYMILPNSVTSIGCNVFSDCMNLKSVTIPDGVTELKYTLFYNCTGLTEVIIPAGVTKIGIYAFENCSNLTDIYYAETEEQWNRIEKESGWDARTGDYTVHYNYKPEE